eukprot:1159175-Pelagomonas_calceolata.AAC.4
MLAPASKSKHCQPCKYTDTNSNVALPYLMWTQKRAGIKGISGHRKGAGIKICIIGVHSRCIQWHAGKRLSLFELVSIVAMAGTLPKCTRPVACIDFSFYFSSASTRWFLLWPWQAQFKMFFIVGMASTHVRPAQWDSLSVPVLSVGSFLCARWMCENNNARAILPVLSLWTGQGKDVMQPWRVQTGVAIHGGSRHNFGAHSES